MPRLPLIAGLLLTALPMGCVNRWNTRMPSWNFESREFQRREATHQDPFPDDSIGPELGFRPPGYELPRTDALRTKNHYYSTILKQRQGTLGAMSGPGAQYPEAVHID